MSKLNDAIEGVRLFVSEVVGEVKKSTWPTRQELTESTIVVIVTLLFLAMYVGISDKVLVVLLRWLIPPG